MRNHINDEYRELRALISVLGDSRAQWAADHYVLTQFIREAQHV